MDAARRGKRALVGLVAGAVATAAIATARLSVSDAKPPTSSTTTTASGATSASTSATTRPEPTGILATTSTCREAFGRGATVASESAQGLVCLVDVVTESTIRPKVLNTLCNKFSMGRVARFESIGGDRTWRCYVS